MKANLSLAQLAPLRASQEAVELEVRPDRAFLKPHLQRITYPLFPERPQKENCQQIMVQSCISQRTYDEIWDQQNENKIRAALEPSEDGSSKALPQPTPNAKDTLNHYRQYKKLEKTLLRKDFGGLGEAEGASVSVLERSEALRVLPLSLGLGRARGEGGTLNLTNYNLGDRYVSALAAGLREGRRVERCLLGANRITDVGLGEVARAMGPEVAVLDLSHNKITALDKRLLEMIIEPEYRLREINLAGNQLRVTAAEALFRNARYSAHLRVLHLSRNRLTPACLDALADLLEKSASLEQLYIAGNYLAGKAGERVFGVLAGNRALRVLDYSLNQLGDSGELGCARALAGCLRANRTLQHLDVSFNNFGRDAAHLVAEALEPNHALYGFHFRGNYGWVDSRGFLVGEEKEETLLDSVEPPRMSGFDVTVIRESHSLKSQPLKNVCWVCEGWHEQEFRLTLPAPSPGTLPPASPGTLLVYLHFDFEAYRPRLISQGNTTLHYLAMVPPKKYRYFFTHDRQYLLDPAARVELLPIAEKHSWGGEEEEEEGKEGKEGKEGRVERVSFRTSKAARVFSEAGELCVKTVPRARGVVAVRAKEAWSYAQSVWAREWRLDDEELERRCFERDWRHSKISNLIKNAGDQERVRGLLGAHYAAIRTVYRQFASWSPFGDVWAVSNQPFTEFCQQARIINKDTPLKITDLTFITTNSMSGPDWKGNALVPERGLVRFQFMEALVRLAEEKFRKNGVFESFGESVEALLRDHLLPLVPQYNAAHWRTHLYFTEQNDALLKKYRPLFAALYRRNSRLKVRPGDRPFMCLAEFRSILERAALTPYFPERDALVAFNCAMMTQVDELESERFIRMTEIEFIEALARIAHSLPRECALDPDHLALPPAELPPLHLRFEWLIQQLKPLCPEDVRAQFPDTLSIFRLASDQDDE